LKVIITGMGRSGTSLVTGLLQMCGLYLGNNLLLPRKDNPKGFFEDLEFLAINREMFALNSNGGGGGQKPPKEIKVLPDKLITQMKQFIDNWPKNKIVGWKDPRACITIRIWKKFIEPEKLKVVIVRRPYSEIANSLNTRHNMNKITGLKLCKIYYHAIDENLSEIDYVNTFYHNYFKDWIRELKMVSDFIGLEIPKNKIESFIDIKLWHNRGK